MVILKTSNNYCCLSIIVFKTESSWAIFLASIRKKITTSLLSERHILQCRWPIFPIVGWFNLNIMNTFYVTLCVCINIVFSYMYMMLYGSPGSVNIVCWNNFQELDGISLYQLSILYAHIVLFCKLFIFVCNHVHVHIPS